MRSAKLGKLARALVSRKWWWTTLLVLAGMALLIRLGIWQLDRLEQRRAANEVLQAQLAAKPVLLNNLADPVGETFVDRQATVRGEFDFSHQMLLKLQSYRGQPGGHLLTPLHLEGSDTAILVDRGWLPEVELSPELWGQYDESGLVEITGYVQASEARPESDTGRAGEFSREWYRVDVPAIAAQLPYPLLPYYVRQSPTNESGVALPARETPEFDLSEGPHLSYALQWFAFTLMLGAGYLYFVYRQLDGPTTPAVDGH